MVVIHNAGNVDGTPHAADIHNGELVNGVADGLNLTGNT
jgi:hypothetical protein